MNYNYFYSPFDFYKEEIKLRKEKEFLEQLLSLRTILSGGYLIKKTNINELEKDLKEVKEILLKEYKIRDFSIKASNFDEKEKDLIKRIVSKYKGEFLVRLIKEGEEINVVFDLIGKRDLSNRFYLIKKPSINPVIASNIYMFLNENILKKVKNIAFLNCDSVAIEFIYTENLVKGAVLRKDLDLFKIFNLNYIEEIPELKTEKNYYCLNQSSLNVDLSRKMARVAKVEDLINFSRTDLFWIDWKFEEKELDLLFTQINEKKEIEDFFYQSSYVSKYSLVVFDKSLNNIVQEWAEKYNLKEKKSVETKKLKISLFY